MNDGAERTDVKNKHMESSEAKEVDFGERGSMSD